MNTGFQGLCLEIFEGFLFWTLLTYQILQVADMIVGLNLADKGRGPRFLLIDTNLVENEIIRIDVVEHHRQTRRISIDMSPDKIL